MIPGNYITIEGIDGCGKSTLAELLSQDYPDALLTQEPVEGTWHGDVVREALRRETGPFTDAFLFMADRAEHLHSTVKPALQEGKMVISDRSADSTYAYQSLRVEAPLPFEWFDACYEPWDIEPDLTLWIDVEPETAIERVDGEEKYEKLETLHDVRVNYERLNMENNRYHRIDGEQGIGGVYNDAKAAMEGL